MLSGVKMFGGMFVFGFIAAADMPTGETQSQVNPRIAHLQTFFTAARIWFNRLNLIEMCTLRHRFCSIVR